ncbi:thermonuclease family protein [Arsenicitalea aurantiaca]|uniref:Thermonuclease family protein n=1 Tax=Arsenicitalea aurantiaca TaxID=1783274 RepID=A0A433XBV0_9HYPH|nr:thermonuclease family protein [Arsenicitalea aurantiaca]
MELGLPSMALQQVQPRLEQAAEARFTLCAGPRHDNCVIDGDTIRHGGNSIRIADINTPEARGYQCAAEAVLARQASLRLLDLLAEGPFEIRPTGSRDTDIYGRQLRVLVRDGQSLGMQLVAEGLAHPWEGSRRSWCG